jgi:hypothetical protein
MNQKAKTLGILGGCLLSAHELGRQCIFHQRVRRRLASEDGLNLKIHLASYGHLAHPDYVAAFRGLDAFDEIRSAVEALLAKNIDVLLFQLRPALHWCLTKPFSMDVCDERLRLFRHPRLGEPRLPAGSRLIARAVNKLFVRAYDITRGKLAFASYADELIEESLTSMLHACTSRGIRLYILSSTSRLHPQRYRDHVRTWRARLKTTSLAGASWVPFDFGEGDASLFHEDGFHLNSQGHELLAQALYAALKQSL